MSRYGYAITEKALRNLLREVVTAHAPELLGLVEQIDSRALTRDEREMLREAMSDELAASGLDANDEPNDRGLLVEAVISWLGQK